MMPARRGQALRAVALLFVALGPACARDGGCANRAPAPAGRPSAEAIRSGAPGRSTEFSGKVVRVRDGDSLVVLHDGVGAEIRLDGVDAPELVQAFGRKARGFTADLALGRVVRVAGKGRDKYGRNLAEVFLPDGRSLNRELVSAGFAWWFRRHSDDRDLEAREAAARQERRGLWAAPRPEPPWEFRESRPRSRGPR